MYARIAAITLPCIAVTLVIVFVYDAILRHDTVAENEETRIVFEMNHDVFETVESFQQLNERSE